MTATNQPTDFSPPSGVAPKDDKVSSRRYALESLEKFIQTDSPVVLALIEELVIHGEIQHEVLELKKSWTEMVAAAPAVIQALGEGDLTVAGHGVLQVRTIWMPVVDTAVRLVSGLAQKNHFHPRPCWADLRNRCGALRMMLETAVGDTIRTEARKPLALFENFESWLASEPVDPTDGAWYDRDHLGILRWLSHEQKHEDTMLATNILGLFFKSGNKPKQHPYRISGLPGYINLSGLMAYGPIFNQMRSRFKRSLFASSLGAYPHIEIQTPGPSGELAPHRVVYRRLWRNLGSLAKLLGSIRHCVPGGEGLSVFFRPLCDHLLEIKTISENPVFSKAFERVGEGEMPFSLLIKKGSVYLKEIEGQVFPSLKK